MKFDKKKKRIVLSFPPSVHDAVNQIIVIRVVNPIRFLIISPYVPHVVEGNDTSVRALYENVFRDSGFRFDNKNNIIREETASFMLKRKNEYVEEDFKDTRRAISSVRLSLTQQIEVFNLVASLGIKLADPSDMEF